MGPYKNVYTAAEYKQLQELNEAALEQNKILKRQMEDACSKLAKHAQDLIELRNDKAMLLQQIERSLYEQKVELPVDVAISLGYCREAGMSNMHIIASLDVIPQLFRDYCSSVLNSLTVIRDYSKKLGSDDRLLEALVNGYTIEQTPAEKLTAKVEGLLKEWFDPDGSLSAEHIHQVTQQIVEHAEELIT
ncbi:hypothetical protein ACWGNU_14890 [Paenibacillus lautus]